MDTQQKNDLLFKLMLVLVRDRQAMQGRIRSVGYTREYGKLPKDLGVYTLGQMSDEEITALVDNIAVRKMKPVDAKSDIYMNDVGYVIYPLSTATEPLKIIDGVTEEGLAVVCQHVGLPVEAITDRIAQFQQKKESGRIGDTVVNRDPASPFRDERDRLAPLIQYFMFTGSERGESHFSAEGLIDYTDPLNTNTWVTYEPEEAVEAIWDRLTFRVSEDVDDEGVTRRKLEVWIASE